MEPSEQDIAQQKFKETYTMGVKKPTSFVYEVPENKHGIDNPVQDLNVGDQKISGNITFDGSTIVNPPVVVTLQNQDGVMALQQAATLTSTRLLFADSNGLIVQDADLTFVTDTLTVTKIAATNFTGNVTLSDINLILGTATGTKFGTSTSQKLSFFNSTPIVQPGATTDLGVVLSNLGLRAAGTAYPITTSGAVTLGSLTSGRVPFASTGGLLVDDADMTFSGDTLIVTKISAALNGTLGATTPASAVVTSLQVDSITNDTGLAAGVYTPTDSAHVNLDGTDVTMTEAQYLRVGNTVTVSGRFTADPTLTATTTSFEITLPVSSDIGAAEDAAGVAFCGNIAAMGAEVYGVAANNTAIIIWKSSDVTSQTWSYTFTYQVI